MAENYISPDLFPLKHRLIIIKTKKVIEII